MADYIGFNGAVDEAGWSEYHTSIGDGIVNDNRNNPAAGGDGQSSWVLTTSPSSRAVSVIRACDYRVRGVTYVPPAQTIALGDLPAPSGSLQQAHMVVAELDRTARTITAKIVSGTAQSGTPSRPGLTRNSTVWQDPIWVLRGGNGASGTLEVLDYRRWVGATFLIWSTLALNTLSASAPVGSTAQVINGDTYYLASRSGVLDWINLSNPAWSDMGLLPGITGGSSTPQTRKSQGERKFRGNVQKASGSWGPGIYTIGSVSDAPGTQRGTTALPVSVGTATNAVNAWVTADGTVRFQVPAGATVTSFYLDPMTYALEP